MKNISCRNDAISEFFEIVFVTRTISKQSCIESICLQVDQKYSNIFKTGEIH